MNRKLIFNQKDIIYVGFRNNNKKKAFFFLLRWWQQTIHTHKIYIMCWTFFFFLTNVLYPANSGLDENQKVLITLNLSSWLGGGGNVVHMYIKWNVVLNRIRGREHVDFCAVSTSIFVVCVCDIMKQQRDSLLGNVVDIRKNKKKETQNGTEKRERALEEWLVAKDQLVKWTTTTVNRNESIQLASMYQIIKRSWWFFLLNSLDNMNENKGKGYI